MLTSLRDAANSDEADVVNILINALTRDNPDKSSQPCDTDKLRKGLGRVSFESRKVITPNVDHLQSKSVRTSVVIPNAPVNKDHQTLLDTLADLACSKSPVRTKANSSASAGQKNWRPRAMSEPWLVDDFRSLSGAGSSMSCNVTEINSPFNLLSDSLSVLVPMSSPQPHTATIAELHASGKSVPLSVPIGIAAWASRKMNPKTNLSVAASLGTSTSVNTTAHLQGYGVILPQILEGDYRTVYNKNGRIGIYTREERQSIIRRFQDKRRNRVWKKKIRYHCRKNLADRRVRIKGRFVRAADGSSPLEGSFDSDAGLPADSNRNARLEGENDGVTSSEEGEAYPMEVVEPPSVSASDHSKDSLCANIGDSSFVDSSAIQAAGDTVLPIGNNSRSKSRGKQQCGEGSGSASMGSAMDGMKAFWGAIHEPPSTVLQSQQSNHLGDSQDANRVELETGPLESSKEECKEEEEEEEMDGLWTENAESLGDGSESKKRFRRYTIAY